MKHYILENKKPVEVNIFGDFLKMMEFEKSGDKHVGYIRLGDFWISTIFLNFDHGFGRGEPVLYETMIFNREDYQHAYEYFQTRCCTYQQAEEMHQSAVKSVKAYNGLLHTVVVIKCGITAIGAILLIYLTL